VQQEISYFNVIDHAGGNFILNEVSISMLYESLLILRCKDFIDKPGLYRKITERFTIM
jgi:hypothetical protein